MARPQQFVFETTSRAPGLDGGVTTRRGSGWRCGPNAGPGRMHRRAARGAPALRWRQRRGHRRGAAPTPSPTRPLCTAREPAGGLCPQLTAPAGGRSGAVHAHRGGGAVVAVRRGDVAGGHGGRNQVTTHATRCPPMNGALTSFLGFGPLLVMGRSTASLTPLRRASFRSHTTPL